MQLTLTVLLQVSAIGAPGRDYATAFREVTESGRPLVVLVGADWCPGCRQMKDSAIPALEKQGGLDRVSFAYVNTDQQSELAGRLMKGGSIPQLIVYHKTDEGWRRKQLTGAQSVPDIQQFLDQVTEESPVREVSTRQ